MQPLRFSLFAAWLGLTSTFFAGEPSISGVRGRGVSVRVPAGIESVTIEGRYVSSLPGVPVSWRPLATKYPRGAATTLEFSLATALPPGMLRVSGTAAPPLLDAALLGGLSSFAAERAGSLTGSSARIIYGTTRAEESSVWDLRENRLCFYSELHGLQIFDLTHPGRPILSGTLPMAGNVQALHRAGGSHLAVVKPPATWRFATPSAPVSAADQPASEAGRIVVLPSYVSSSDSTEIVIADIGSETPRVVARVMVGGKVLHSQMAGRMLFVTTQLNPQELLVPLADETTLVVGIDLSDPANPVARPEITLPGATEGVVATDRLMVVAHAVSGGGTKCDVIDLAAPDGTPRQAGSILVSGLNSQNTMQIRGSVFTLITRARELKTFSISDPASPVALGTLTLPISTIVRSIHFAGGRVYAVGYDATDPLLVVDVADAAHPFIASEIAVPGLHPLFEQVGDRLLTMTIDHSAPLLCWYDVLDAQAPRLLHRLPLKARGYDPEILRQTKSSPGVFKIFPEQNLILFLNDGGDWGWTGDPGVGLVDFLPDRLVARGTLANAVSPQRVVPLGASLVAISARKIIAASIADRNRPRVLVDAANARPVDQVIFSGGYLLQLGERAAGLWESQPALRVARADDPEKILTARPLGHLPVLGATVRDGVLYLAQGEGSYQIGGWPVGPAQRFVVSAYDLHRLPAVRLLGSVATRTLVKHYRLTAHWPSPGILVWEDSDNSLFGLQGYYGPGWISAQLPSPEKTARFTAFDFTRPEAPQFLSAIAVSPSLPAQVSDACAINGRIFLSYKVLSNAPPIAGIPADRANRNFLYRIDFSNPRHPRRSDTAISLPGHLRGVENGGRRFITTGQSYDPATGTPNPAQPALHVTAFDGTAAHLTDAISIGLPSQPVQLQGRRIVTLNAQPAFLQERSVDGILSSDSVPNANQSSLATLRVDSSGKIIRLAEARAGHDTELLACGDLLVTTDAGLLHLFDARNPTSLENLGAFEFDGWIPAMIEGAGGDLRSGLWVPAGEYGIETIARLIAK